MTIETLIFLRNMLTGQSIQVGAPDFLPVVEAVTKALAELDDAISKAG